MWTALKCLLFGHRVNDLRLDDDPVSHRCECGEVFLIGEQRLDITTRIRHTVSCFVRGHQYHRIGIAVRHGHHEYVCDHCGHTLLMSAVDDPFVAQPTFRKKVRYFCNLFGHRVHRVTTRDGYVEHACGCGHAFLQRDAGVVDVIKHPLACLFVGHYVRFVTNRDEYAEYQCSACGHPFCFARAKAHHVGGEDSAEMDSESVQNPQPH